MANKRKTVQKKRKQSGGFIAPLLMGALGALLPTLLGKGMRKRRVNKRK